MKIEAYSTDKMIVEHTIQCCACDKIITRNRETKMLECECSTWGKRRLVPTKK